MNKLEHLYIHIPFCKSRCGYCNFVSFAGMESKIDDYVGALCDEIDTPSFFLPLSKGENAERSEARGGIRTVYVGGGTPSLLGPEQLSLLFSALGEAIHPDAEISIEANPATADRQKLTAYRRLGINRLSIGGQTFNNDSLKMLGRIHSEEDITDIFAAGRSAGFSNINLDLMYALPDQTLNDFKRDIEKILELNPEHISLYNLEVEKLSTYHSLLTTLGFRFPDNDVEADMYQFAIDRLKKAGFKHYEISNFARPGKECQHNLAYWRNRNYLGLGAGAHSHLNGKRWSNPDSLEDYLNQNQNRRRGYISPPSAGSTDPGETIFMGLRLLDGIPKNRFLGFENEVISLKNQGLLEETADNIKLTHKGLFLGNLVFEQFV